MDTRKVKQLFFAEEIDMGDIPVRQPFPTQNVSQIDPFLLLHHHKSVIEPDSHPQQSGVDPHPHRGFTPVTFVIKGSIHHRDSRGNSQLVEAGGVQWLDAGRGVIHSERPGTELAKNGGELELIQLWINTPQSNKMDDPRYFAYSAQQLPTLSLENGLGETKIICGEMESKKGIIPPKVPLLILSSALKVDATQSYIVPPDYNLIVYVISGKVKLKGFGIVEALNAVHFENQGTHIEISAISETKLLLLAGKPISEPVVSHGPFVMNSQTDIMTAMRDYKLGKMGILIEDFE
jgi:hypothetical protein